MILNSLILPHADKSADFDVLPSVILYLWLFRKGGWDMCMYMDMHMYMYMYTYMYMYIYMHM